MNDTYRCRDCEALITQEWDLCERCHADWMDWVEGRSVFPSTKETA